MLAERKSKAINVHDFRIRFRILFYRTLSHTSAHDFSFFINKMAPNLSLLDGRSRPRSRVFFSFIACQMKIKRLAFGKARKAVPLVKNIRSRSRI